MTYSATEIDQRSEAGQRRDWVREAALSLVMSGRCDGGSPKQRAANAVALAATLWDNSTDTTFVKDLP